MFSIPGYTKLYNFRTAPNRTHFKYPETHPKLARRSTQVQFPVYETDKNILLIFGELFDVVSQLNTLGVNKSKKSIQSRFDLRTTHYFKYWLLGQEIYLFTPSQAQRPKRPLLISYSCHIWREMNGNRLKSLGNP